MSMAVPARKPENKKDLRTKTGLTAVQVLAAQQMASGLTVAQTAHRLVDYIVQNSDKSRKDRIKLARTRIRRWSKTQEFRDTMYELALVQLDLKTPHILQGLGRKAAAGRVDAAKLVLALTERYQEKGEVQATHVEVRFEGVPRPQSTYDVDGEATEAEEEA